MCELGGWVNKTMFVGSYPSNGGIESGMQWRDDIRSRGKVLRTHWRSQHGQ